MKQVFVIIILTIIASIGFSQENIRPSCRNHKAGLSLQKPNQEQLDLMESMAFRSDTFDITHYAIHLENVDYSLQKIDAFCSISFSPKMEGQDALHLDLLNLMVDSVLFEGEHLDYVYDSIMLHVQFDAELDQADTFSIDVYYGGHPSLDPSGFGGFDFQDGYSYNLGIGLASIPHNFGRGWFPCFDNFVERSTYEFFVTTLTTQFAYCVGTHVSTEPLEPGFQRFHYYMYQPITTYQAAVAIADYAMTRSFHEGLEKEIPIELVSKAQDTTKFRNSFAFLAEAVEALEQWYGPYQWERVGYVITTRGAMEHPTCVAYPSSLGLNENPYNNMDIMSHELAHHWFGNLTTLTTAYDMWIKEGTSEYGYHLFTKEFLGDEEFIDLIGDNQFDVIENAHRADDGFRALSGMPFEYTYGTTTYQKGAAVIHNMHSYLGDSLFKVGVRAVLDKFAFSHCDAAQFEETLTQSTGVDMSDFFKDWIYAPGFSSFEIDSIKYEANGEMFDVTLFVEQKLFHSPHYHTRVPMEITFFDKNWNTHIEKVYLDGQYSEVNLSLDFLPVFQILNDNSFLNNGQLSYTIATDQADDYDFDRSKLEIEIEKIQDSVLLFVEHIWGAPDPILREDLELDLSDNHYWVVDGVFPEGLLMSTKFYYEGNHEDNLDFDLTGDTEKDIILLYRPNASKDWVEYPHASKNAFIPTDSKGFFIVDSLLAGQYCFANGDYFEVATEEQLAMNDLLNVHPNPVINKVIIKNENALTNWILKLSDLHGHLILEKTVIGTSVELDLSGLNVGTYFIEYLDRKGSILDRKKIIKIN